MAKKKTKKRLTALEVLKKAKKVLERDGWAHGSWDDGKAVCAVGALHVAVHGRRGDEVYTDEYGDPAADDWDDTLQDTPAGRALAKAIRLGRPERSPDDEDEEETFDSIIEWNDASWRREEDVLTAFDTAIARLKRKQKSDRAYRRRAAR